MRKILTIDVSKPMPEIAGELLAAAKDTGFFYICGKFLSA